MTRIFEALKKAQGRPGALPFPPVETAPLRPPVTARPPVTIPPPTPRVAAAAPVATLEPAVVPRIEAVPFAPLPAEVTRQMMALRVGIEAALENQKSRIVMFVGAMGCEGVTTVAAQFAAALAADSRSVLLLNARVPLARAAAPGGAAPVRVTAPSRGPAASPGAAPPARGAETPARPTLSTAALGEDLRRAGSRAPAAARATLQALAAQFEWVVVDGPPVLEAPESVDLAPLVDGVVLVIRSGYTKRPVAMRAAEMLHKSGVRVLGSVLNRRHLEIPDFIYRRI